MNPTCNGTKHGHEACGRELRSMSTMSEKKSSQRWHVDRGGSGGVIGQASYGLAASSWYWALQVVPYGTPHAELIAVIAPFSASPFTSHPLFRLQQHRVLHLQLFRELAYHQCRV